MKNFLKRNGAVTALLIGISVPAFCQDSLNSTSPAVKTVTTTTVKPFTGTKGFRTFSIGINGGLLAPVAATGGSNDFTKWKTGFGYGAYIKNQFRHNFALQLDFLRGTTEANNEDKLGNGTSSANPYSSVKTTLDWATSLSGVVTFGNINYLSRKVAVIPYLSVGGGLAAYKPELTTQSGETIKYKANDESIKEFFVPVAGGLKINAAPGINVDLGYRIHFVDGDNFDGYAAGPNKDKFSYGFAGLEFALGKKDQPQLMVNNPVSALQQDLQDQNDAMKASLDASIRANDEKLNQVNALKTEIDKMKADADKDGVSDYFDKCPNTPDSTKVDGAGCPLPKPAVVQPPQTIVITEEDRKIVNEAIKDLEFDFGKATIRSKSYPSLDKVAELLVQKNFTLKLAGHTDNVGSESANLKLSKDRAESVKAYLVSKGVNASRIEATGYGETQPIASNKTNEGRQKNRRVEFTLF
ncbi:OmpA family protein [Panacibacter ginsenosidivorans]|uniref:OmpA family protein n=1 Tax=Panacibacter ginsenosidivorans TaxID=1813871 RepID=A0A5B8VEF1_9BACT|nr:OmpA family protein [Panacibacter ginsenosidivorans]QEC69649.1 OmpA family protein [Panacibacter ginsenosidivorans]